jgi:hypothetical protein
LTGITMAFTWTLIGQEDFIGITSTEGKPAGIHGATVPNTGEELFTGTELQVNTSDSRLRYQEKQGVMHAGMVKGSVGAHRREDLSREILREEICSVRRQAGLKHGEAQDVRMLSVVPVMVILSAGRVTADSQAGRAVGPVVEDRSAAGMEPEVGAKSAVAVEPEVGAKSAVAVEPEVGAKSAVAVDSMAEALAADGGKMKDSKKDKVKLKCK